MSRNIDPIPIFIKLLTVWYRFDENYGLASTQSLKNKDIPEGGAKGTILPSWVYSILLLCLKLTFIICVELERARDCVSRNMSM